MRTFNLALGSSVGKTQFHLNPDSQTNSILSRSTDPNSIMNTHSAYQTEQMIDVEVMRLDEFCAQHEIPRIDLLKLDVQGYELEVLRGCGDMLTPRTIRFVILEALFASFYENQAPFDELMSLLRSRGYRLFNLFDLDMHHTRGLIQANALFCKA